jgi:hypothetical protein
MNVTNLKSNAAVTTGDARRLILETIVDLRNGAMPVDRGQAIAANMRVLNESMMVEVKAARLAMEAKENNHDFGEVVQLGQRQIAA